MNYLSDVLIVVFVQEACAYSLFIKILLKQISVTITHMWIAPLFTHEISTYQKKQSTKYRLAR